MDRENIFLDGAMPTFTLLCPSSLPQSLYLYEKKTHATNNDKIKERSD